LNWRSYALSAAIVVALGIWFASGMMTRHEPDATGAASGDEGGPMRVQVRQQAAQPVTRWLTLQGETRPDRRVTLRAETSGRVVEVLAAKGERVAKGDAVIRLAMDDRQARLEQAEALLSQRRTEYEAAKRLDEEGFQARTRTREAFASLQAARAELAAIRQEIDDTVIRAAFDGLLNDRMVELGDYLRPGDPAGELISNRPLRVRVNVAQGDVGALTEGGKAQVALATGAELSGEIDFIAAAADTNTRTFRVEVVADNRQGWPSGVGATVRVPLGDVEAHRVSPAVLALNEAGELGAKAVNDSGQVVFHPIEIVRSDADGVWVTGLPPQTRIITVGQAFVTAGEPVEPVAAEASPLDLEGAPQDVVPGLERLR